MGQCRVIWSVVRYQLWVLEEFRLFLTFPLRLLGVNCSVSVLGFEVVVLLMTGL